MATRIELDDIIKIRPDHDTKCSGIVVDYRSNGHYETRCSVSFELQLFHGDDGMYNKQCACCHDFIKPHTDYHEGRMSDYCDDCKWMRCDVSMHGTVF